jgi:hypothetical protein
MPNNIDLSSVLVPGAVNASLPVMDAHNTWPVFSQLGRASKVWSNEKREACARLQFSQRGEVKKYFRILPTELLPTFR